MLRVDGAAACKLLIASSIALLLSSCLLLATTFMLANGGQEQEQKAEVGHIDSNPSYDQAYAGGRFRCEKFDDNFEIIIDVRTGREYLVYHWNGGMMMSPLLKPYGDE